MLKFLNSHKTKIVGALLVALGALQANSATVQQMVKPSIYAWMTVVIGVLVAVLGFLNSASKDEPPAN